MSNKFISIWKNPKEIKPKIGQKVQIIVNAIYDKDGWFLITGSDNNQIYEENIGLLKWKSQKDPMI